MGFDFQESFQNAAKSDHLIERAISSANKPHELGLFILKEAAFFEIGFSQLSSRSQSQTCQVFKWQVAACRWQSETRTSPSQQTRSK